MNRFVRRIVTGAAMIATVVVGVGLQATPADAQTRSIVITDDVNIRPNPNTSQAPLKLMPKGSHPTYICYADGENRGGTTKWFKISWGGVQGYYSSIADDVPLAAQSNIESNYGIPRCGTGADINQGPGKDATVTVQPETRVSEPYNRSAAATWAFNHAMDVRGNMFADCTWFVSQALWAGGLHQTSMWNSYQSRQGAVLSQPGTDTARGAPNLVSYLQQRFPVMMVDLRDVFSTNAVSKARPGDIIAYDWENDGTTDHLAFIVNIAPGQYPEVSEWGTLPIQESYKKRGWTWSDLNSAWLQEVYPRKADGTGGVNARLLHFNLPS